METTDAESHYPTRRQLINWPNWRQAKEYIRTTMQRAGPPGGRPTIED